MQTKYCKMRSKKKEISNYKKAMLNMFPDLELNFRQDQSEFLATKMKNVEN